MRPDPLALLEAKIHEFKRGTPRPNTEDHTMTEYRELETIHKTLNVVLAEIKALRKVAKGV